VALAAPARLRVVAATVAAVATVALTPAAWQPVAPVAAAVVSSALARDGVTVHTGVTLGRVEREAGGHILTWTARDGTPGRVTVGAILVAAGRRPAVEGLGLEAVGVAVTAAGITVDDRLRTTVPGIWAAGDVTGGPQFTHVADYQGKLVVRNALTPFKARADYRAVPRVTYTDPELAQVGLTAAEAEGQGIPHRVWRYPLADLDRALADRRTEGFVQLVASPRGRLLGATIAGAGAGELITTATLALTHRLRLAALAGIIYPYPTMSEGLLRAANLSRREALGSPAGRLLKRIVRWGL